MSRESSKLPLVLISSLIFVIVIGIAVTVYITINRPHSAKSLTIREAQIDITDQGFSPSDVQISPGTRVTWINKATAAHQVASDPYPGNTAVPGLNSGKTAIAPGQTYSFTFSKTGSFGYHDDASPTLHGLVTVKQ